MVKLYKRQYGIYRFFRSFRNLGEAERYIKQRKGRWRIGLSRYVHNVN